MESGEASLGSDKADFRRYYVDVGDSRRGRFSRRNSRERRYKIDLEEPGVLSLYAVGNNSRDASEWIDLELEVYANRSNTPLEATHERLVTERWAKVKIPEAGRYIIQVNLKGDIFGKFRLEVEDFHATSARACDVEFDLLECADHPGRYDVDADTFGEVVSGCADKVGADSSACRTSVNYMLDFQRCLPQLDLDDCIADPETYLDETGLSNEEIAEGCLAVADESMSACGMDCFLERDEIRAPMTFDSDGGHYRDWIWNSSQEACIAHVNDALGLR